MKKLRIFTAALAATALALSACSSSESGDSKGGDSAGASDAVISVNNTEPQNPLIPANTNETGGGLIVDNIYAGLQYYDAEGNPQLEMAESIETEDNQTYTITLKADQVFTDGSPVNAESFVNAWNQAVEHNMLNSYFFEGIAGYDESLAAAEAAVEAGGVGDVPMSGLVVVDDLTFTVELKQAEADFPLRLGYSAFYPLPEAGIGDPETVAAFGANPIGNGPYMVKEGSWEHNVQIELVPNPDYTGDRQPQNGGILMKFYSQQDAAYNDLLSGQLDVLDAIPDSAFGTFEAELGDRAVNEPSAIFQSFTIPESLEHFSGEEGDLRRQAISMAINREEITETIFQGTRTPASDFVAPVIPGHNENLAGNEVLQYNPEKAAELWAEADAINPWTGTFQIGYNSDGGHQAWVDAVANQLKNNLGIDASGAPYPDFKSLRDEVTNRTITTAFRTGWQADYPSAYNFLAPLYATGASANDGDYSNAEFDQLLKDAMNVEDPADAQQYYDQAQEILLKELPAFPLWYSNVVGGSAEGVENVQFGWNSKPILHEITK
ncbi:MAG: ABC transporter substrate-binding protein [Actinomycetaceae bacterium]|nr:ABC transporter substrate-binding protein [Actinomycetaceae bacterium]